MNELCIIGDKANCLEQLHALYDEVGGFGTFLMVAHDWDDKAKWVKSMNTLAYEIVPALT